MIQAPLSKGKRLRIRPPHRIQASLRRAHCFSDDWKGVFDGATRFVPIDYQRDWRAVRQVAKASGTAYDAATYAKLNSQEASLSGKKKSEE